MAISVTESSGNTISVTVSGSTSTTFSTTSTSVSVTPAAQSTIDVKAQGPKGDKGDTGSAGATGPAGADGQGVPAGGSEGQVLVKSSATDYDTAWDYVESTYLQVENAEATSIPAGTVVYAFGISGSNITVKKADASNSSTMPAIGVVLEEIASGSAGEIITSGLFNKTISGLSGINVGDTVYVSETAGGVTTTKPTGTALIQNIGVVLKTSGSNIQKMKVSAIDRVNDIPNIPNGQAWIGNASGVPTPTTLATVATTGAYSDLSGTPTIPSGDLVDDTTPQLGGDLDVNGNKITSASNGNITIDPDGTGAIIMKSDDIQFDGGGVFGGKIKLYESDIAGSNFVAISAPLAVTADTTLTLPDGAGSAGQALTTNGSGTLSWSSFVTSANPTVSGLLSVEEGGADTGRIALYDIDGSNYVLIKAADTIASNVTFVLPAADGSANQVIKTDGSGNLSFVDQSTGTVDTSGTPANNQLAVFTDADTIEGDANLTWTGTLLTVVGTAVVDKINVDESSISSAGQYGAGSRVLDRIGSNTLSITAGDLYYLGSASWAQADADAASTASGLLAIATSTTSNNGMLVNGVVKVADNAGFSSASEGDVLYVSTTAGHVTTTAPTATGDIVRVVGYVLDPTNGIIYFDPSKDWIELS
jgi:predicted RecA/RadA family phage recombinase